MRARTHRTRRTRPTSLADVDLITAAHPIVAELVRELVKQPEPYLDGLLSRLRERPPADYTLAQLERVLAKQTPAYRQRLLACLVRGDAEPAGPRLQLVDPDPDPDHDRGPAPFTPSPAA